jgi:hypothetical protein
LHAEFGELYEAYRTLIFEWKRKRFLKSLKATLFLHAEYAELYEARCDADFESKKFCDFCGFCVKQIASMSVVIYNPMYSIHQVIHVEID